MAKVRDSDFPNFFINESHARLDSGRISDELILDLFHHLKGNLQLKSLSLICHKVKKTNQPDLTRKGIDSLCDILSLGTIESLDLYGINLKSEDMSAFMEIIIQNKNLIELSLDGDQAKGYVANIIGQNNILKVLTIEDGDIDGEEFKLIINALDSNKCLHTLSLRNNKIGTIDQWPEIMLPNNMTLENLDLSKNRIDFNGVAAITSFLQHNRSLKVLKLCFNDFGDQGVELLVKPLANNNTLISLDLLGNEVTLSSLKSLSEIFKDNKTLLKLNCESRANQNENETDEICDFKEKIKLSLENNKNLATISLLNESLTSFSKTPFPRVLIKTVASFLVGNKSANNADKEVHSKKASNGR